MPKTTIHHLKPRQKPALPVQKQLKRLRWKATNGSPIGSDSAPGLLPLLGLGPCEACGRRFKEGTCSSIGVPKQSPFGPPPKVPPFQGSHQNGTTQAAWRASGAVKLCGFRAPKSPATRRFPPSSAGSAGTSTAALGGSGATSPADRSAQPKNNAASVLHRGRPKFTDKTAPKQTEETTCICLGGRLKLANKRSCSAVPRKARSPTSA